MKRLISLFVLFALAIPGLAQTPEVIITRMEEVLDQHESEGIIMTVDVKVPLLGTMSTRTWILGEKMRAELRVLGQDGVTWTDATTQWTYMSSTNKVEIERVNPSSSDSEADTEMLKGIGDGYDVSIDKETAEAWYLLCKKSKSNKEKDDPKKINLVVSKSNYYPISLSAKMDGVTMTLRDISFGVTEKQVTFNAADYPGIKIVDKR